MLSNCDDIIRQHKAACLRVTSLLACKDLIWIGTSAGVILTISAATYKSRSNITGCYGGSFDQPIVTGLSYGHTGHVRFLTCVDFISNSSRMNAANMETVVDEIVHPTSGNKKKSSTSMKNQLAAKKIDSLPNLLIISGGDGYEDFRNSTGNPMSDVAGREDSTNHLLLWQV